MATFQTLVTNAQVLLQDAAGNRYTSAQLMGYANEAIAEIRRIRPDLFFGSYTTALASYNLASTFPLSVEYETYVTDYMVSRSEMRDDEASNSARSVMLMQRFRSGLLGV